LGPELWQFAGQPDRTGDIETCGNLIVQPLVWTLVIEHVAKVIESALLCGTWRMGGYYWQSLRENPFLERNRGSAIGPTSLSTSDVKKNFTAYVVTMSWMQLLL